MFSKKKSTRTHGSVNLIIKEVNVNYIHDRMKQIEIIVHKFSLVLRQKIFWYGWD
jgi:hypothetical protein